ncbi:MAG TPA: NAD(P)H-binding protein [Thermoleophilaceae bacterium]
MTGATGFVGGRLVEALSERGADVRCLVRDADRAKHLADAGHELHEGDVLRPETLAGAGRGADVAYYLVHSMGRGSDDEDFEARERRAAKAFAEVAEREGVKRVIYLGGLGDQPGSAHLRSRHLTATILAEHGPPLTYFRAAMVVGAKSESYRTLKSLVERLPAMLAPRWLSTTTQPIAIDDAVEYLAQAPEVEASAGREVQIGGPDVLSYGEMLDEMARVLGKRPRPKLPVPVLSPRLSAMWIGLVTPVDTGVARPLVEGLSTRTVVTDRSGSEAFGVEPTPFREALCRAHAEETGRVPAAA